MNLVSFLRDSTAILEFTNSTGEFVFLKKIPFNDTQFVVVQCKCNLAGSSLSDDDKRKACLNVLDTLNSSVFHGRFNTEDILIEKMWFILLQGDDVYFQNSVFLTHIIQTPPTTSESRPIIPEPSFIIRRGWPRKTTNPKIYTPFKNTDNLCSIESIFGLFGSFPEIIQPFFKNEIQDSITHFEGELNMKTSLSPPTNPRSITELIPNVFSSLNVTRDSLETFKEADGLYRYNPDLYPVFTGCNFMYSLGHILLRMFYDETCLTFTQVPSFFLSGETSLDLVKEDRSTVFQENVLEISNGNVILPELSWRSGFEPLPTFDFIKSAGGYSLVTFINDDMDFLGHTTTELEMKQRLSLKLRERFPKISLNDIKIIGGVGDKYTTLPDTRVGFANHFIFFVFPTGETNGQIVFGDSQTGYSTDTYYVKPRMVILRTFTGAGELVKEGGTGRFRFLRNTLRKSSRNGRGRTRRRIYV